MKQFFLLAACMLLSFMGRAQVPTIDVLNNRPCDVYIVLFGDNGCGTSYSTAVTQVPSTAQWVGLSTSSFTWSGGGTPAFFTGARVYQYDPSVCTGASFVDVGEGCVPFPPMAMQTFFDNTCAPCPIGSMGTPLNWDHHSSLHSTLIIHP